MTVKKRRSLTPTSPTPAASAGGPGPGASDAGVAPPQPGDGVADGSLHATRRGGARRELTARVSLKDATGRVLDGWALNVSKGGLRIILEDKVDPGGEFQVTVTAIGGGGTPPSHSIASSAPAEAAPAHTVGRIVWVQEEPDGVVAGIEFRGGVAPSRDEA